MEKQTEIPGDLPKGQEAGKIVQGEYELSSVW